VALVTDCKLDKKGIDMSQNTENYQPYTAAEQQQFMPELYSANLFDMPDVAVTPQRETHYGTVMAVGALVGIVGIGGLAVGAEKAGWIQITRASAHNTITATPPGDAEAQNPNLAPPTATPTSTEIPSATLTPTPSPTAIPKPKVSATEKPSSKPMPATKKATPALLPAGKITALFVGDSLTKQAITLYNEKGFFNPNDVEIHADWAGGMGLSGPTPNYAGVQSLINTWLIGHKSAPWVKELDVVRIGAGPNMSESGAISPYCDSLPGLRGKALSPQARQYCTALGLTVTSVHTLAPKAQVIVANIASETHKVDYDERNAVVAEAADEFGYVPEDIYTATHPGGHPTDMELDAHNSVNMQHTPGDAIDDYLHPTAKGYQLIFNLDKATIEGLRSKH
jgi:hypothetical protein